MREPAWRRTGKTPDYRFSLANERTFLAWVRTALALLAGAVAIDQLAPEIAPPLVRMLLCLALAGIGAVLAVISYRRWAHQERAMRHDAELPHSWLMLGMAAIVSVAAIVFAVLILVRP
ncbi:YidH family protein [Specibacter sp. NPDC057265]|uniref:YidH family protein n=1 Tax=Specibacter sp. NPDC057265 TaxID=3346075 RepID=UPI0036303729